MFFRNKKQTERLEDIFGELPKINSHKPDLYHLAVDADWLRKDGKKKWCIGSHYGHLLKNKHIPDVPDDYTSVKCIEPLSWSLLRIDDRMWFGHFFSLKSKDASECEHLVEFFRKFGNEIITLLEGEESVRQPNRCLELIYSLAKYRKTEIPLAVFPRICFPFSLNFFPVVKSGSVFGGRDSEELDDTALQGG